MTLTITQGSDWSQDFTWTEDDNVTPRPEAVGSTVSACLIMKLDGTKVLDFTASWFDDTQAQGVLSLTNAETMSVPEGAVSEIAVTIVEAGGFTHKIVGGFGDVAGEVAC